MTHPFFIGITFPVDIKRDKGEKSTSARQVRYAFRIICIYGKKPNYLRFTVNEIFRKLNAIPIKF